MKIAEQLIILWFVMLYFIVIGTYQSNLIASYVRLRPNTWVYGTAWAINKDGYYITAGHCVIGMHNFMLEVNGKMYATKVVGVDYINDIAIVKSSYKSTDYVKFPNRLYNNIEVGEYGYPVRQVFGSLLHFTSGVLQYGILDSNWAFVSNYSCHGNSGGPLVNHYGEVVGILDHGYSIKFCSQGGDGPGARYVEQLAHKYRVKIEFNSGVKYKSFKQLQKEYISNNVILILHAESL